jgi:hypothetical protein
MNEDGQSRLKEHAWFASWVLVVCWWMFFQDEALSTVGANALAISHLRGWK